MPCRICFEDGDLIQPCNCSGTVADVHKKCLMKWIEVSGRTDCEICKYEFPYSEIEEEKQVKCPAFHVSEDSRVTILVFFIGCMGLFSMVILSTFWNTMKDLFMYTNSLQLLLLVCLRNKNTLETYVFWKGCSTLGFFLVSLMYYEWTFTIIEAVCTCILGVITFAHLKIKQSKHTVRHIIV